MLQQESPTARTETPVRFFESRAGDSLPNTGDPRATVERHSRSGLLELRTPYIPTDAATFFPAHSEQFDSMAEAATYAPISAADTAVSPRTTMLARTVSDVCSPAALALPCLLLAAWSANAPGAIWYAVLYAAVAVPLPMLYVVWLVRTGRVTDFHLPNRHERARPFAVALVSALAAVVLLIVFGAPAAFLAPIVAVFMQTFLLFLVTLVWQISIHTATTAGLATFVAIAIGGGGLLATLIVPLVAWARIHLGRHTLAQTIAGALLGCGTFIAMFALRDIAW
jgi:membrane-associated phospholipid phosphatase